MRAPILRCEMLSQTSSRTARKSAVVAVSNMRCPGREKPDHIACSEACGFNYVRKVAVRQRPGRFLSLGARQLEEARPDRRRFRSNATTGSRRLQSYRSTCGRWNRAADPGRSMADVVLAASPIGHELDRPPARRACLPIGCHIAMMSSSHELRCAQSPSAGLDIVRGGPGPSPPHAPHAPPRDSTSTRRSATSFDPPSRSPQAESRKLSGGVATS